jgi:hypothetical protein
LQEWDTQKKQFKKSASDTKNGPEKCWGFHMIKKAIITVTLVPEALQASAEQTKSDRCAHRQVPKAL